MKKKYESVTLEILLLETQDVITASTYVEWGPDWNSNKNHGDMWVDNIFG